MVTNNNKLNVEHKTESPAAQIVLGHFKQTASSKSKMRLCALPVESRTCALPVSHSALFWSQLISCFRTA